MKAWFLSLKSCGLSSLFFGFVEAIGFFIVPDVLISFWSLKGIRAASVSVLSVVIGAVFGAAILYFILDHAFLDREVIYRFWAHLPGFYASMPSVAEGFLQDGAVGFVRGPQSGIPFRIFVVEAFHLHIPFWSVLAWAPIARLERIIIAPIVVLLLRWAFRRVPTKFFALILCLYWIGLYYWYWLIFLPSHYGIS